MKLSLSSDNDVLLVCAVYKCVNILMNKKHISGSKAMLWNGNWNGTETENLEENLTETEIELTDETKIR